MVKREISIGADERVISNDEYRTLATTTKVLEIKKVERIKISSIINDIFGGFNKKHPEFIWIVLGCIASYFYRGNIFSLPQTIFSIYFIIKGTTEFIAAIVNRINNA